MWDLDLKIVICRTAKVPKEVSAAALIQVKNQSDIMRDDFVKENFVAITSYLKNESLPSATIQRNFISN